MHQLYFIANNLGYKYISLTCRKDKNDIFKLQNANSHRKNPYLVKKMYHLRNTENEFVYDIETETGNFNAGIGELCIKNTDSVLFPYRGHFEKELEKFQKLTKAKQTSHLKSLLSEAQQCKEKIRMIQERAQLYYGTKCSPIMRC